MKTNQGFDLNVIQAFKGKLNGAAFLELSEEDSSGEFRHIQFIGRFDGHEVVYDAIVFTLRFQHELELYEMAEHEAAKHFPNYKKLQYHEDENGNLNPLNNDEEAIGMYMAEVILELQEEEVVKVKEHVDIDSEAEFGVGLSVGLHQEAITDRVLDEFIFGFNSGTFKTDDTWYSFHHEEDDPS